MTDKEKTHIQRWTEKINWKQRVKSVCKPCWEIKYCPYGPLVEDFPLSEKNSDKSCRIFGHDCPVFYVAEPFTETKELRKITRHIPRATQFRVMKRENQICQVCRKSVIDEDIEFDHVIPWSKGGSSDESNIRLLCSSCNKKRCNNFEEEYLIDSISDFLSEPDDEKIFDFLKEAIRFGHQFYINENRYPHEDDFAECLNEGKKESPEIMGANYLNDLVEFFNQEKSAELEDKIFNALKYRWGFLDRKIHRLKFVCNKLNLSLDELLHAELDLLYKMGIRVKDTKTVCKKLTKK
jgi:hypothetical protein